jgi:redox-sensitive bicupin YhaK (pirin superfamily)
MLIHQAESRGFANHGWLKSHHTFSFADYYDPERMGFGVLRVINDDYIDPAMGFGTHPHKNMEIITIPLEGTLAHKDSTGTSSKIRKGEVQIMSAGIGIAHSEFNASQTEPVKLLQIWVMPKKIGVTPRYEQKDYSLEDRKNKLQMVVAPDGREGAVSINQDAYFSLCDLDSGKSVTYTKQSPANGIYVFVIAGEVEVNGKAIHTRDGIGFEEFESLEFLASKDAEILLMEVPV